MDIFFHDCATIFGACRRAPERGRNCVRRSRRVLRMASLPTPDFNRLRFP